MHLDTKEFILYHNLGLGDHIICNGLVNYISTKKDNFFLHHLLLVSITRRSHSTR